MARGPLSRARVRLATLLGVCAVLVLAGLAFRPRSTTSRTASALASDPARPVSIVPVRVRAMPVTLEATGSVVSEHVVQVRPQISGLLKRVYFTEGEPLRAGRRLFLIDPAPYQADLDSARAVRDSAHANLERITKLAPGGYVTPQDYLNARAAAEQAEAAYRRADINLSYTDIRAAIAGRSGSLGARAGNLVSPTDPTPLVTIEQIRPIEVQFNLAQPYLPSVRASQAKGTLRVSVLREDRRGELDQGAVVFIDNAVNAGTGTLALKARLPNEREQLWPGELVSVQVQLSVEPRAVTVPETAVQTGPSGNYVYVVVAGRTERRPITVDRHAGELAVIAGGLHEGEPIVERVPTDLRPGMAVVVGPSEPPPRARVQLPIEGP